MKSDRVNELYHGKIFDRANQLACQHRIHWMCSKAEGKDILDFACSQGIAALLLGRQGCNVVGVDIDPTAIEVAQQALAEEVESVRASVRFDLIEPGPLRFADDSFDTVIFGEILEHLTHPDTVFAELKRVCRPGGRLVITTPFGVLRHPDHVATYYLSNFVETIGRHFAITDLRIENKYIYCAARNAPAAEADADAIATARMLQISESAFEQAESTYLERWEKLRGNYQKLVKERDTLSGEVQRLKVASQQQAATHEQADRLAALRGELEDKLNAARESQQQFILEHWLKQSAEHGAEIERLRAAHRQEMAEQARLVNELRGRIDAARAQAEAAAQREQSLRQQTEGTPALQQQLKQMQRELQKEREAHLAAQRRAAAMQTRLEKQRDYLEAELECREQEVRYRLGDAIVSSFYHPTRIVRLPVDILRLFRDGHRRRSERARADEDEVRRETPARVTTSATASEAAVASAPVARRGNGRATLTPVGVGAQHASLAVSATTTPATVAPRTVKPRGAAPPIAKEQIFVPPTRPNIPPRLPHHIGAIMDEFTSACFRDECRVTTFGKQDWQQTLESDPPQMVLIESTWAGNGGKWKLQYEKCDPLRDLTAWCRQRNIPTVFWNKEDPPNFERFIHSAGTCDYVFTSDENCIPDYRQRLGHDRVASLAFAAQPNIHNPIDSLRPRLGNFCFAGTYYRKKYPQRRHDIDVLLRAARTRGLTIFDRQFQFTAHDGYLFPDEYQEMIRGGLPYEEMLAAYKAYHCFLNVNSVRESPTMYSRRVLELLACGTAVVSTPSLGMEQMLGRDAVAIVETEEEAAAWMDRLIRDEELRRRMIIRGQRRVFSHHTYQHRLAQIFDAVGIARPTIQRRVTVVTVSNRPEMLTNAIDNYARQAYADKEWIIVLNSDDYSLPAVKEQVAHLPNVRVYQQPEAWTLGACLNSAISESEFEYFAKFDDDDFYGEHYLTDQINAFLYCNCPVVGKRSYLAHMTESNKVALRFPNYEHRHSKFVAGATLVVRRSLFNDIPFREDVQRGVDTQFEKACVEHGVRLYSTDRYNFVAARNAGGGHTWKISDDEFLSKCAVLPEGTDPREYASV